MQAQPYFHSVYILQSNRPEYVNEADCIPAWVSCLGKQTSASRLKRERDGQQERYSGLAGLGPEDFFFSAVLWLNHKINPSCIQMGEKAITVAAWYTVLLLT